MPPNETAVAPKPGAAKTTKTAPKPTTPAPARAVTPAKTTKAPGASAEQLAKARAARDSQSQNDVFTFANAVPEAAKRLSPQAQVIVNAIKGAGKRGITRKELVAALEGAITTKQPISRVLSFYQKQLTTDGHVAIEKAGKAEDGEAAAE